MDGEFIGKYNKITVMNTPLNVVLGYDSMDMTLQDVRIYDRVLNPEELKFVANPLRKQDYAE